MSYSVQLELTKVSLFRYRCTTIMIMDQGQPFDCNCMTEYYMYSFVNHAMKLTQLDCNQNRPEAI